MVFLEDELEQEEEDLVELYEEDVHDEVVWLVSLHQSLRGNSWFQPLHRNYLYSISNLETEGSLGSS